MDVLLMKMNPEIRGTCALAGHEGEIELLGFNHGIAIQMGGDKNAVNHQDFKVTKHIDEATPELSQACAQGKVFQTVEILVGQDEGGKVLSRMEYTLRHVVISAIAVAGGGEMLPVETVSMAYGEIQVVYNHQGQGGSGGDKSQWDLKKDKD